MVYITQKQNYLGPLDTPIKIQNKIHIEIQRLLTEINIQTVTYTSNIQGDKDYNTYLVKRRFSIVESIQNVINYTTNIDFVKYIE